MDMDARSSPGRSDSRIAIATVFVCIAFALLARHLNQSIGYANGLYNCDAWYFFGLQFNFADLHASHRFYQTSRFPALVPWIYLGNVIPYPTLNALKFTTYFALTCVAFMWFGLRLFGIRVAVLMTVLFCCSTSFLGVLSHDYLTGAGLMWISLLVGSTVEAGRSRQTLLWSVVSGVLFGMCVYTHLPTGLFIFAVPAFFCAAAGRIGQPFRVRLAFYVVGCLIGFVLISVVLGLYNMSLGGTFYYVDSQVRFALRMLRGEAGRTSGLGSLRTESAVPLILVMIVASAQVLWRERGMIVGNPAGTAAAACFATVAVVLAWELSGRILLQGNVYGAWIFPVIFAGIGAVLSRVTALGRMHNRGFAFWVCAMLCLLLAAAATARGAKADDVLLAAKTMCGVGFLLAFAVFEKSPKGGLVLLPLTGLVVCTFPTSSGSSPWYAPDLTTTRDMTLQAANALRIYHDLGTHELPAFWVDARQPEVTAIPRSYLLCMDFPASFPDVAAGGGGLESPFPPLTKEALKGAKMLVVVAKGSGLGRIAAPTLDRLGFYSQVLGEWPIGAGTLNTSMVVLRLEPRDSTLAAEPTQETELSRFALRVQKGTPGWLKASP